MVDILGALKKVVTFDIRKFTTEPVKTGILPIGAIGAGAVKAAGVTATILKKIAVGTGRVIAPRTIKGAIGLGVGVPTAVGVFAVSPAARKLAKEAFDPRKTFVRGKGLGGIIEDPSKILPKEKTFKEKVGEVLKEAGPIAAVGAAVAGAGLVVAKKVREKITPSQIPTFAILPAPSSITPTREPLGAVQRPVKEIEAVPSPPVIKITNKPEINISFRKSRKFINQQILVK